MPPYTYTTFEEIEAKGWAVNTLQSILIDTTPVSFEADYGCRVDKPSRLLINEANSDSSNTSTKTANPLRRSFSFLEGNLFSMTEEQQQQKNARRSQSTMLPSTSTNISKKAQSVPTTPRVKLSPQSSFSRRIRETLHNAKSTSDIFDQHYLYKKSKQEQKAIAVWKSTFAEYMSHVPPSLETEAKPKTKKSEQLSKFIMTELLTTEETYLNHLMIIKNLYMDPLIEVAESTSLVNLKYIENIFAFIPQLITLSSTLYTRLYDTVSLLQDEDSVNYEVSARVGKIFCELEPYFDIYIAYTLNFPRSKKYLSKADSSIVYRQLVEETMRKKEKNRMTLSEYMIAPIQRITRYCLLLKDLLKYSGTDNPGAIHLTNALRCLSALAFAMNTI